METRRDSLLSHPDSCPADGVHLKHWEVEAHHYVRDVSLDEDASRIRINPLNFARLRTIALNILRANGVKNVGQALFRNALNLENILSYRLS